MVIIPTEFFKFHNSSFILHTLEQGLARSERLFVELFGKG